MFHFLPDQLQLTLIETPSRIEQEQNQTLFLLKYEVMGLQNIAEDYSKENTQKHEDCQVTQYVGNIISFEQLQYNILKNCYGCEM